MLRNLHQKIVNKEVSVVELTEEYLKKIRAEDKDIDSFLKLTPDLALEQAKQIQEKIDKGEKMSPLAGMPVAVKDNILIEGIECTAGSKILEGYNAPYNATVIEKLNQEGAVFLGKTNMDEFAMGISTENSGYKITKNPLDKTRVPGGSSGGSAAATKAEFCAFSLGSDTGGSVRQPAALCGLAGLRPSYGSVSRYGLIAMASSLDQIGPIANSVEDVELVFNSIKGKDQKDFSSVDSEKFRVRPHSKKIKIGLPAEYFEREMEEGVREAINNTVKKAEKMGFEFKKVSLSATDYALSSYYIIVPSEVSSNLARYDGIKYGSALEEFANSQKQSSKAKGKVVSKTRGEKFGKEVKRRIILGTFALSAGYYDQFYLKANKARNLIRRDFEDTFKEVDLILAPTSPTTAFKIGEKIKDPVEMYTADIFTAGVSLADLPALSLPCGESNGLPVGMQLIGNRFGEDIIFDVGKRLEAGIQ